MDNFIQLLNPAYIAFAFLVVGVLTLLVYIGMWYNNSKTNRIEEERDRKVENLNKKAFLSAQIIPNPNQQSSSLLKICNRGESVARAIKITLDGQDLRSHPTYPSNQPVRDMLGPMSEIRYVLAPNLQNPNPSSIQIKWTDDSDEPGLYES